MIRAVSKSSFHLRGWTDTITDAILFPFEIFYAIPSASFQSTQFIELVLQSSINFVHYFLKLQPSSQSTFISLLYMFYFN
jgi:hypothetical protein